MNTGICYRCHENPRLAHDSYCRECRNSYNRDWLNAHPEKRAAYRNRLKTLRADGLYERQPWQPGKAGRPPRDEA